MLFWIKIIPLSLLAGMECACVTNIIMDKIESGALIVLGFFFLALYLTYFFSF